MSAPSDVKAALVRRARRAASAPCGEPGRGAIGGGVGAAAPVATPVRSRGRSVTEARSPSGIGSRNPLDSASWKRSRASLSACSASATFWPARASAPSALASAVTAPSAALRAASLGKNNGVLRLNGSFHCGRCGTLGLRCRTLSLQGGFCGRSSDRFSKSGTCRVPFSRSPFAEEFRGLAVFRARAFAHDTTPLPRHI